MSKKDEVLDHGYDSKEFWDDYVVSYENQVFDMSAVQRGFKAVVDAGRRGPYGNQRTDEMLERVSSIVSRLAKFKDSGINWSAMGMSSRIAHLRRNEGSWTHDDVIQAVGGLALMVHYYMPMMKKFTHTVVVKEGEEGVHLPKMMQGAMKDVLRMQWTKPFGARTIELKKDGNYRAVTNFYSNQKQLDPEPFWVMSNHKLMEPAITALYEIVEAGFPSMAAASAVVPGVIVRGGGLLIEAVVPFNTHKDRYLYGDALTDQFQVAAVSSHVEFSRGRDANRFAGGIEVMGIAAYQMATGPSSAGGGRKINTWDNRSKDIASLEDQCYRSVFKLLSQYSVLRGLPYGYGNGGDKESYTPQGESISIGKRPLGSRVGNGDSLVVEATEGGSKITTAWIPPQIGSMMKRSCLEYGVVSSFWYEMVKARYFAEFEHSNLKEKVTFAVNVGDVKPQKALDTIIDDHERQAKALKADPKKGNDSLF